MASIIQNKVDSFLRKYEMHPADINAQEVVGDFLAEMKAGLEGKESSLPMIPTFVEAKSDIPKNKQVLALDAGGTNLRAALISFNDEGKADILDFRKTTMPGFDKEVTAIDFFNTFADFMGDLAAKAETIGFCFSYPVEILPSKDGRLIKFTKEIKAPEVEGMLIGENLLKALKRKGVKHDHRIILLNDTVSTLLSGLADNLDRDYSSYIGFILGTGINSCYIEKQSNITKVKEGFDGNAQIVNIEAGFFGKSPRGPLDIRMDKKTQKPGLQLLEKMISGAYFGLIATEVILQACEDDLFSPSFAEALKKQGSWHTPDVDKFLNNPARKDTPVADALKQGNEKDKETFFRLINTLLERTALLTAINMAAIIRKSGAGDSPVKPVCLAVDGTTFYRFFDFRFRVEKFLRELLAGENQKYYDIVKVEDAPLIGAAIAALTN